MAEIKSIEFKATNGKSFVVRHAVESDAADLIACATRYIEDGDGQIMVPGEFQITEEKEREWIKGLRENSNELLLVAEFKGRIIGNIDFHIGKRQRTSHAGIFGMGIVKEWRSQGVGSALLGELIKWAKSNSQVEKISLRVLANNQRAIGLYKKFGFQQEGYCAKEIKISPNEYVDDLQMGLFVK